MDYSPTKSMSFPSTVFLNFLYNPSTQNQEGEENDQTKLWKGGQFRTSFNEETQLTTDKHFSRAIIFHGYEYLVNFLQLSP